MFNSAASIMGGTVLADMLNAPISKLAMSEHIDLSQHLFNGRSLGRSLVDLLEYIEDDKFYYLLVFNTVLKDILNHQASCLS